MGQDNEDVKHFKVDGRNGEEIDRNHAGGVIAKECFPILGRGTAGARGHIVGDGSLRATVIPSLSNSP